jgi:hypothetical protein
MKLQISLSLACLASCVLTAGTPPDALRIVETSPLRFEPAADGDSSRFVARGIRFQFEFSSSGAVFQQGAKKVRLSFQGAAPQARMEGVHKLPSNTAMYIGNDPAKWRRRIANYGRLQVSGLYPGIDAVYYGNAGELEYDLTVKPGADPGQIRLRLEGARARVDRGGNLIAGLIQKRPVAYQIAADGSSVPVESRYRKNRDGSYGFALGAYDRSRELIIDPVLALSSYLGYSQQDVAYAIGHDRFGFLYIAGTTQSSDLLIAGPAFQPTPGGLTDLFLMKIDPNVDPSIQIVFSTFIGGSLNDAFGGMTVSPDGQVFITGSTMSGNFPAANAAQSTIAEGTTSDAFVCWFDTFQTLLYSSYLGGSSNDYGYGIAYDSNTGRIWVTGGTQSDDFPNIVGTTGGRIGSQDIFVTGIDPSRVGADTRVYSTYLGGTGFDTGRSIAVAPDGTLWVAGGSYSFDARIVGNSYQPGYGGGGDAYVAHLNPALGADALLYSTYLGGDNLEEARNVVVDSAGRAIVSGYTISSNFPTTSNALQRAYGGNTDAFISIIDPSISDHSAQLVYSTFFGGANADAIFDMKLAFDGALYISGMTTSPGLPTSANALQATYDGSMDAFILKLVPSRPGTAGVDYLSYLGSGGVQVAYGIDVLPTGNIYLTGFTSGSIFSAFGGASKPTDPGNTDVFLIGFNPAAQ